MSQTSDSLISEMPDPKEPTLQERTQKVLETNKSFRAAHDDLMRAKDAYALAVAGCSSPGIFASNTKAKLPKVQAQLDAAEAKYAEKFKEAGLNKPVKPGQSGHGGTSGRFVSSLADSDVTHRDRLQNRQSADAQTTAGRT